MLVEVTSGLVQLLESVHSLALGNPGAVGSSYLQAVACIGDTVLVLLQHLLLGLFLVDMVVAGLG